MLRSGVSSLSPSGGTSGHARSSPCPSPGSSSGRTVSSPAGALKGTDAYTEDSFQSLHKSTWYIYGALLTQGGAYEPQTSLARSVVGAFWLYAIVMVATYGGNLIAFLSIAKQEMPFETLSELLDQSKYKYGMLGGSGYAVEFPVK